MGIERRSVDRSRTNDDREITMKRLLVVDDALFMRKMICGVAAEAGWEVVGEAGNGAEAVTLYSSTGPTW